KRDADSATVSTETCIESAEPELSVEDQLDLFDTELELRQQTKEFTERAYQKQNDESQADYHAEKQLQGKLLALLERQQAENNNVTKLQFERDAEIAEEMKAIRLQLESRRAALEAVAKQSSDRSREIVADALALKAQIERDAMLKSQLQEEKARRTAEEAEKQRRDMEELLRRKAALLRAKAKCKFADDQQVAAPAADTKYSR
ncbi:MAG: hypothetical protein SGILL_006153, partial [Bacillariaceae sp.]